MFSYNIFKKKRKDTLVIFMCDQMNIMLRVKMHTSEIQFKEYNQIKPKKILTTIILNKSFGLFCTKSN